jgi:UTP-glucose-1-phosphate uridylyltransferase
VYGRIFTDGRYDIGKPLGFLQANIELALQRADIGPELADYLRRLVHERDLA